MQTVWLNAPRIDEGMETLKVIVVTKTSNLRLMTFGVSKGESHWPSLIKEWKGIVQLYNVEVLYKIVCS